MSNATSVKLKKYELRMFKLFLHLADGAGGIDYVFYSGVKDELKQNYSMNSHLINIILIQKIIEWKKSRF